jgi:hypothetical protein
MRRIGAFVAAALLALSLGSAVVGASSRSSLNADFEAWMDGVVVGHITIRTAGLLGGPGTYTFEGTSGQHGSAVIGDAQFYRRDGFNEVWFKALEVGYPTEAYGIFIARAVDMLDPSATDTIEFWSAPIDWSFTVFPDTGGTIGSAWHGTMDVGAGAFVLKVRGD